MSNPKTYGEGINWSDPNTSHVRMLDLVGVNKSVLEFGCWTGYMSKVLRERGCRVTGIEQDQSAAQVAAKYCDEVIVSDLDDDEWVQSVADRRFDVAIFGDVLEHLKDPLRVLERVRPLLNEGGYVVASIPNIAHGSVRLALLSGEFNYRPLGLLDKTHLRFFTRVTIEELFAKAGFLIVDLQRSTAGIFNVEIRPLKDPAFEPILSRLETEEDALTYQFICKAVPADTRVVTEAVYDQLRNSRTEVRKQQLLIAELELQQKELNRRLAEESRRLAEESRRLAEESRRLAEEKAMSVQQLERLNASISALEQELAGTKSTLDAVFRSKGWRLLNKYREIKGAARRIYLGRVSARVLRVVKQTFNNDYERWIKQIEQPGLNPNQVRNDMAGFSYRPKISIVMPVYNTPSDYLRKAIKSVQAQIYDNWELCICDDGSPEKRVRADLQRYSREDNRILIHFSQENLGISGASNRALQLARGEFVGLLDHDDELSPYALYEVVRLLQDSPETDLIYSDEDKLGPGGVRTDPFLKPDWSPEYFLSCMYVCHFGVYRRGILEEIGGFRRGFEGSQDYDLVLRFTERTRRVQHIPKILYHWRMIPGSAAGSTEAKPYAYIAAKKALTEHLQRTGRNGCIIDGQWLGHYRAKFEIVDPGMVSIIIPTRDRVDFLKRCIASIDSKTTYRNYEIVVVDNQSVEPSTDEYLRTLPHHVVKFSEPFNFSRLINFGVKHAQGKYLLFLNNDTEVISSEWLFAMLEFCQQREIGAVGAKLLFPDNRIQHIGVVLGLGGIAGHPLTGFPSESPQYFGTAGDIRNYSAVTAACMMIRRAVFEEVRGFDENLSVAYNDVDFCLRIREAGYRIVATPYAKLYHYESASRGYQLDLKEVEYMRRRWGAKLDTDPYYNPNLTLSSPDFGLRF